MNDFFTGAAALLAFLLTLAGTPIAKRAALRYRLLDFPDGRLKVQESAVPYMGGVIVYFSLIVSVSLFFSLDQNLLGILLASSILLVVGLFDDMKALTPGVKFLFQLLATYILVRSGILIQVAFLPYGVKLAATFFIILSAINAYNIIDILDGFACSVGAVSCLAIFVIAVCENHFLLAILASALFGTLVGFLKFNWSPAQIYLGDAGSMVLGMLIGSMAIMGSYTTHNAMAFVSGFFILGVPFADLIYVVTLRLAHGRSPFRGSLDHIALRLKKRFDLSVGRTVAAMASLQLLLSGLVVFIYFSNPRVTQIVCALLLLSYLFGGWALSRVKIE